MPLGGILTGLFLALLAAASVAGYAGEVAATIEVSGPSGPLVCNSTVTVTARVEDVAGDPIDGQPVDWSFDGGSLDSDSILDATTTTNSDGVASTRLRLGCPPHALTILAQADDASGTAVIASTGIRLPATNTAPGAPVYGMALAVVAVVLGAFMILRRVAADRR